MLNQQGLRSALHIEGGANARKRCDEGPSSDRATQFPAWRVVAKLLALVVQKISQGKFRHQSESRNFPHEIVPCRSFPCMGPQTHAGVLVRSSGSPDHQQQGPDSGDREIGMQ